MLKNMIKKSFLYNGYKSFRRVKQSFFVQHFPVSFIRNEYKKLFGEYPNLDNPITFSEKILWLKLNYRNDLMVQCADKVNVREYVANKIGINFLNEFIFVYNSVEEVDFSVLPNQFVFKPNNSSGRILICKDKERLDIRKSKRIMKRWENENLYKITGEWIYKDIPYKLICEKFLGANITDYKMYFTYGEFIATQVITDRKKGFFVDYFDDKWNHLDIERFDHQNYPDKIKKPINYDIMLEKGSLLSKEFPFSRIDFYNIDGRIYFGEISFFPNNGFVRYKNMKMDRFFAERIIIPPIL